MNNYQLNTNWCLWYHSINDNSWKNSSYKELYKIRNLYDLKCLNDTIKKIHLQNSMFFIMREDIFPTWEDPDNRNGCCVSFKISSNVLDDQWNLIINMILSEDIIKEKEKYDLITGVSISPKKEFNIVKIWLRENVSDFTEFLNEYEPFYTKKNSLIKKHELSD